MENAGFPVCCTVNAPLVIRDPRRNEEATLKTNPFLDDNGKDIKSSWSKYTVFSRL
jgi:hypothetical protein